MGNSHKTIIRQFHKTIRIPWEFVQKTHRQTIEFHKEKIDSFLVTNASICTNSQGIRIVLWNCLIIVLWEFPRDFDCLVIVLWKSLDEGDVFCKLVGTVPAEQKKHGQGPIERSMLGSACDGDLTGKARRCEEKASTPCQYTLVAHNPTDGGKIIATPCLQVALTQKVTDKEQASPPRPQVQCWRFFRHASPERLSTLSLGVRGRVVSEGTMLWCCNDFSTNRWITTLE